MNNLVQTGKLTLLNLKIFRLIPQVKLKIKGTHLTKFLNYLYIFKLTTYSSI